MDVTLVIFLFITVGIIFLFMVATGFLFYQRMRKNENPLDIGLFNLTKNGITFTLEKGRRELIANKGYRIVTLGRFGIKSVKHDLGYHISVDDSIDSGLGFKRRFIMVALKDGIAAPLNIEKHKKDLSPDQVKLLNDIYAKNINLVQLTNEQTLNLKPIKHEQINTAIRIFDDAMTRQAALDKDMIAGLINKIFWMLIVTLVVCAVIFVLMLTLGPEAVTKVASNAAANAAAQAPIG